MNDVQIVTLDGPCRLVMWMCKPCQVDLGAGWFVAEAKDPPHELQCDRRGVGTCKGDGE